MYTLEQWHQDLITREQIAKVKDQIRINKMDLQELSVDNPEHRWLSGYVDGLEKSLEILEVHND